MFTGIVEEIGILSKIENINSGEKLITIKCKKILKPKLKLGDSISINGTCLTVTKFGKTFFSILTSLETLSKTNLGKRKVGDLINLERAMIANGRFGGHIVSGHIDSIGEIISLKKSGKSTEYWFKIKSKFKKYLIDKGSICIDGISLTVNQVKNNTFSVNIIPHTDSETNSKTWKRNQKVNLEFDQVAKYLEKLVKS
ncbi:MAG: riboflavin synthase [Thermodesulfobacteriota bacterium]|nr:riboflavin synthase [bacterium]MEC7925277.1 riboflavin synthase [Thermodesulfobacteriota bacterium]